MIDRDEFKSFSQLLANWDHETRSVLSQLQQLKAQWKDICEGSLANHTQPFWIRNHRLSIEADSALWANRIHHNRAILLARLQQLGFDIIHDVQAKVRPHPLVRQPASSRKPVSKKIIRDLRGLAASIDDPLLRAALLRLAHTAEQKTVAGDC